MAELKLTKNELRSQQNKLQQLKKYLPTLQLKKALLQLEVTEARAEIAACKQAFTTLKATVEEFGQLLTDKLAINLQDSAKIEKVNTRVENIAGVEVPYFDNIVFADFSYDLFDTPAWVDTAIVKLRAFIEAQIKIEIATQKMKALEAEWREVSIRVNLFEKILIPRCMGYIKKIRVFLGDQQLAAVSQAKVAKGKIEKNNIRPVLCDTM